MGWIDLRVRNEFSLKPPARLPYSAIDLFAGAGGLSLGLRAAGFRSVLAVDADPSCEITYRRNFPNEKFLRADISGLTAADILGELPSGLRGIDLLAAGPPCQGLSIQGRRDSTDPRNDLFIATIRLARDLQPKYVLIENVPGLATIADGDFRALVLEELSRSGYHFVAAELLAAQYGVPQMRWRMVFLGMRNDQVALNFPNPTRGRFPIGYFVQNQSIRKSDLADFITTGEAIGDLPQLSSGEFRAGYSGLPSCDYQMAMREDAGKDLYNHYAPKLKTANLLRIAVLAPGQDWRDLPHELLPPSMQRALRKDHTRRFRRMQWDTTPRAIVTRFRDPKSGEYIHPDQSRTISIREAARIQSFPDSFEFCGTRSSQYDQVGNAVPPLMARALGVSIRYGLEGRAITRALPQTRYSMATTIVA